MMIVRMKDHSEAEPYYIACGNLSGQIVYGFGRSFYEAICCALNPDLQ